MTPGLKAGAMAAVLTASVLSGACHRSPIAATTTGAAASDPASAPPAIRYQDHIWADGVPPPAGELSSPRLNVAQLAQDGAKLFSSMNCDGCHGGGGSGWVGPSLADGRWRYGGQDDEIFSSIYYGRPRGMPAYGGLIGRDGVWLLVAYLKSLPKPDVVPTESWIDAARTGER